MRRSYAVLTVILAVLAALALFVVAIVPVIADQVRALTDNVPHWLDELQRNRQVQRLDDEYDIIDKVQDYVTDGDFVSALFGGAVGIGLAVLGALFNGFIIIVLTLYFLASLQTTKSALYRLAPASRRDRVSQARQPDRPQRRRLRLRRVHRRHVRRHLVADLPVRRRASGEYAVALAFVVALLDVIPMIGATIGAVIVTAIAFADRLEDRRRLR